MVSLVRQVRWAIEFLPVRWARASDPISRRSRRDLRAAGELKYYEAFYDFLARPLDTACIEEPKNTSSCKVVDKAVEPERKSSPKPLLIIAITAAL